MDTHDTKQVENQLVDSQPEVVKPEISKTPQPVFPIQTKAGVMVHCLGSIITRPQFFKMLRNGHRYIYPVGFKSQKKYYNVLYTSEILEGEDGPQFRVSRGDFKFPVRNSPTAAWECVLEEEAMGTESRVSGPEVTMKQQVLKCSTSVFRILSSRN